MTRGRNYRIESGAATHPVVDMRWNDSLLPVLNKVTASGQPATSSDFFAMAMPPLKVERFNFTSLSN
jgi:predicted Zn-dependent protease